MNYFAFWGRLQCAALAALTGGALAQTISLWGGQFSRHLPPTTLMSLGGAIGAGLAILLLADGFGHRGLRGVIFAAFSWVVATALGAWFGASAVLIETSAGAIYAIPSALEEGAGLGLFAVVGGILQSPTAFAVWVVGGCAMHYGARAERGAGSADTLT